MKGKVKFFNKSKGFGFIIGDDADYFFHFTQVPKGLELKQDDEVVFEQEETDRGMQAKNIKLIKEALVNRGKNK